MHVSGNSNAIWPRLDLWLHLNVTLAQFLQWIWKKKTVQSNPKCKDPNSTPNPDPKIFQNLIQIQSKSRNFGKLIQKFPNSVQIQLKIQVSIQF